MYKYLASLNQNNFVVCFAMLPFTQTIGTTLRAFFYHVLEYHDQSRSFDLSPVAQKEYLNGDFDGKRKQIFEKKQRKNNVLKKKGVLPPEYAVHYIEQEFDAVRYFTEVVVYFMVCIIMDTAHFTHHSCLCTFNCRWTGSVLQLIQGKFELACTLYLLNIIWFNQLLIFSGTLFRWDDSLRIISLRHPIERHFS